MKSEYIKTSDFIKNRWKDAVSENREGEYALPYPFVPPCIDGLFKCLFYWDTFYTNRGMIIDGRVDLAKSNVDNLIYLLNKYGCVPNSNSYPGIKHNSQPPYLHFMIKDVYEATKDEEWLRDAYFALKKEYAFWMNERITPCGLNRYHHHEKTEQECIDFYDYVATRLAIDKDAPREKKIHDGSAYNACGESGHDFSPRFGVNGNDICPVDLNSIIFAMEGNLADWAKKFEPDMEKEYRIAQAKRLKLMNELMYSNIEGVYFDYNYVKKDFERTDLYFAGQFFPYIVGVSFDKKGCLKVLSRVEFEFGIATTSPYNDELSYQAAYPFSWPYDNGMCFWALATLDLKEDAIRVGNKYLELCSKSYLKAGHLWETYNAVVDEVAQKKEYPNKEMMGWTAGVYEWVFKYVSENS